MRRGEAVKSDYTLEQSGSTLTVCIKGETTSTLTQELRVRLAGHIEGAEMELLAVDLAGLSFMNTTGINLLVLLRKQCDEFGKRFVVLRPSDQVLKVLNLVQLADFFDIRDSFES